MDKKNLLLKIKGFRRYRDSSIYFVRGYYFCQENVTKISESLMNEQRWERVSEDEEHLQCQAVTTRGQCINKKMGISDFCAAHGGNRANQEAERASLRMYRLERYQNRVNSHEDTPTLKSLTSELGVLKLILESLLTSETENSEIARKAPIFSNLLAQIEACAISCSNLDKYFSENIDENQISAWVNSILVILESYNVSHEDIRAEIFECYWDLRTTSEQKTIQTILSIGPLQDKLKEITVNPKLKTLHAEIAIQRMILEDILRGCSTTYDLFINATKICNLISHVRNMVLSCSKIDLRSGRTLNGTQMACLCSDIMKILEKHIPDSDDRSEIGIKIIELAEEVT